MNRRRSLLAFVALASMLLAPPAGRSATAAPPKLEIGQPFPNLVLPAMDDGRPLSIVDFRGEKVVLHVFASW